MDNENFCGTQEYQDLCARYRYLVSQYITKSIPFVTNNDKNIYVSYMHNNMLVEYKLNDFIKTNFINLIKNQMKIDQIEIDILKEINNKLEENKLEKTDDKSQNVLRDNDIKTIYIKYSHQELNNDVTPDKYTYEGKSCMNGWIRVYIPNFNEIYNFLRTSVSMKISNELAKITFKRYGKAITDKKYAPTMNETIVKYEDLNNIILNMKNFFGTYLQDNRVILTFNFIRIKFNICTCECCLYRQIAIFVCNNGKSIVYQGRCYSCNKIYTDHTTYEYATTCEICGNKGNIEDIHAVLEHYSRDKIKLDILQRNNILTFLITIAFSLPSIVIWNLIDDDLNPKSGVFISSMCFNAVGMLCFILREVIVKHDFTQDPIIVIYKKFLDFHKTFNHLGCKKTYTICGPHIGKLEFIICICSCLACILGFIANIYVGLVQLVFMIIVLILVSRGKCLNSSMSVRPLLTNSQRSDMV